MTVCKNFEQFRFGLGLECAGAGLQNTQSYCYLEGDFLGRGFDRPSRSS